MNILFALKNLSVLSSEDVPGNYTAMLQSAMTIGLVQDVQEAVDRKGAVRTRDSLGLPRRRGQRTWSISWPPSWGRRWKRYDGGNDIKLALYPGCVMPTEQYGYELSVREVLPASGSNWSISRGFSCCGEPLKSVNQMLTIHLSARSIAICESQGLVHLRPLPHVPSCPERGEGDVVRRARSSLQRVKEKLSTEDLSYKGTAGGSITRFDLAYRHRRHRRLIKAKATKPVNGMDLATQHGCHIIQAQHPGQAPGQRGPGRYGEDTGGAREAAPATTRRSWTAAAVRSCPAIQILL
ncbi:MAG: heterodisulfide reductase-related iron-sulfur binding cluster [Desulfosudis oleivorans]|nr:heterodisulfide reductase-related iron-sulfur binding cluster [Desulfosudis oleivorans]